MEISTQTDMCEMRNVNTEQTRQNVNHVM